MDMVKDWKNDIAEKIFSKTTNTTTIEGKIAKKSIFQEEKKQQTNYMHACIYTYIVT